MKKALEENKEESKGDGLYFLKDLSVPFKSLFMFSECLKITRPQRKIRMLKDLRQEGEVWERGHGKEK